MSATSTQSLSLPGWSICAGDRFQTRPVAGSAGWAGFSPDAEGGTNDLRSGAACPAEEDRGRDTVPGNVRAGRVEHVGEIDSGEKLLDERASELPLHEGIGHKHAREACSSLG